MQDDKRRVMAQELRVRPESIDQMLIDGIPEQQTLELLVLRDEAAVDFDITNGGVQPIKPPVRDVANTYHLFKGDMDKVRQTVDVHKRLLEEDKSLIVGIANPGTYQLAQDTVTNTYQRALFQTVLAESVRPSHEGSAPLGINIVIGVAMQAIDQGSSPSIAQGISVILEAYLSGQEAETIAHSIIEDALKLPSQDVFLRTPDNRRIVISKPDILLALAKYKPGDADYYQQIRDAIGANTDTTREALRRLKLARLMDEENDLVEAGMTAFVQARELLANEQVLNRVGHPATLFDAIATTVESQVEPVNVDSIEIQTLRELAEKYIGKHRINSAFQRLALLTQDPRDKAAYKNVSVIGYIKDFVQTGEDPVEPLADELFEAATQQIALGKSEFATEAIINITKLIELTGDNISVDRMLSLDIEFLDNSRQSRVRNALFQALKTNGLLEAAQSVAEKMKTAKTRERCLAEIAFLKLVEPLKTED